MHKVDGFVLGGVDTGEGDRYLSLYTRELGLVRAVARSVREERSRLRYDLEDFSYGTFRLVRGREVWRVTGANAKWNAYRECAGAGEYENVLILANTFTLVRRLVVGEEKSEHLFTALASGVDFLRKQAAPDADTLRNFEYVLVLRILHALGYVRSAPSFEKLFATPDFSREYLATLSPLRPTLSAHINRALRESQL